MQHAPSPSVYEAPSDLQTYVEVVKCPDAKWKTVCKKGRPERSTKSDRAMLLVARGHVGGTPTSQEGEIGETLPWRAGICYSS
jgi:hypothetical protein